MIRNKRENNIANNQSHSNISILSEEKTPLKYNNCVGSLSPISYIKNIKNNIDELSQNSLAVFGKSEINSTTNSKNYKKLQKFTKNPKYTGNELQVPNSSSPTKSYQSRFVIKNNEKYKHKIYPKKLHDNLTSASSIPRQINNKDDIGNSKIFGSEFIHKNLNLSKLNNKTTIESTKLKNHVKSKWIEYIIIKNMIDKKMLKVLHSDFTTLLSTSSISMLLRIEYYSFI